MCWVAFIVDEIVQKRRIIIIVCVCVCVTSVLSPIEAILAESPTSRCVITNLLAQTH